MPEWVSGNRYLSDPEQDNNALCVYGWLKTRSAYEWSDNAIAAVCGNFAQESGVNPGIWQNLNEGATNLGYGLGQWTPMTKLMNWADAKGLNWREGNTQLQMLDEDEAQWHSQAGHPSHPTNPPFSFTEFKKSMEPVATLTRYFWVYWEEPGDKDTTLDYRIRRAEGFYKLITGKDPDPPGPGPGPGPGPKPPGWFGRKLKRSMMLPRYPF